jgi:hypothetical protein
MEVWILAVIAPIAGWIAFRIRKFIRLNADEHYLEIAREIARVKAAALDKLIEPVADEAPSPDGRRALGSSAGLTLEKSVAPVAYKATWPADPRTLATSAGLKLFYTVRRNDDRFIHHYSVSIPGFHRYDFAGKMHTLFVARLLGVPYESLTLEVERFNVCHAELHLSAEDHDRLAERPVSRVSPAEIASFRREYVEISRRLRWRKL